MSKPKKTFRFKIPGGKTETFRSVREYRFALVIKAGNDYNEGRDYEAEFSYLSDGKHRARAIADAEERDYQTRTEGGLISKSTRRASIVAARRDWAGTYGAHRLAIVEIEEV